MAWYEKRFTAGYMPDDKNDLLLKFEASCFITEVYLYGAFADTYTGVEDPFEFNISDYVKSGENLL